MSFLSDKICYFYLTNFFKEPSDTLNRGLTFMMRKVCIVVLYYRLKSACYEI